MRYYFRRLFLIASAIAIFQPPVRKGIQSNAMRVVGWLCFGAFWLFVALIIAIIIMG